MPVVPGRRALAKFRADSSSRSKSAGAEGLPCLLKIDATSKLYPESRREFGFTPDQDQVGSKGPDAGDFLPQDQGMDVVSAFVGFDGFQVHHVAHDGVVPGDAVGSQYVAAMRAVSRAIHTLLRLAIEMC